MFEELTLGSIAEIRIPSELAYGKKGIPRIVPPDSELIFEVHLLEADGIQCSKALCSRLPPGPKEFLGPTEELHHPWWLARVLLENARSVARRSSSELTNFDVGTAEEPLILTDAQMMPGLFVRMCRQNGGHTACGIFDGFRSTWVTNDSQESLWEAPVYETSVTDYVNYVQDLEKKDPECEEHNAAQCPRIFGCRGLYLNGWPAFAQLPWLRGYVLPDGATTAAASMQGSIEAGMGADDLNSLLIRESEALREARHRHWLST
eukprot:Skav215190  [mRNA]  locus=scaffold3330:106438:108946:- [translate_table: standard]